MGNKKSYWKVLFVIAVVLVIVGLSYICWFMFQMYTSGSEYGNLRATVTDSTESSDNSSNNRPNNVEGTTYGDTPDAPLDNVAPEVVKDAINGDINFTELWKINTDLYAWINIPNTMVDYPIAQYSGDDDEYYLSHNMYKESAFVYLPDRTLTYHIFAAYEYDNRHLLYSFNFDDKSVFQNYLDYAQNPTSSMMYKTRNLNVNADDKIITLSTCLGTIETSRYLVQGVLIKDEPTSVQ